MTMADFFIRAGDLQSHRVECRQTGDKSHTNTYVACFDYAYGQAEFDGRVWTFRLAKPHALSA